MTWNRLIGTRLLSTPKTHLNPNQINLKLIQITINKFKTSTCSTSASSKPIPSFLPSQRTLEFRVISHPTSSSSILRRIPDTFSSNSFDSFDHHSGTTPNRNGNQNFPEILNRTSNRREDNWTIKCTEINNEGNIVSSKSMSKSEICAQNGLQPRDLRRIDSRISNVVPSILVRKEAIIFNVLNIRALIKANSVILFDHPYSPSVSISSTSTNSTTYLVRSAFVHKLLKNLSESSNSIKRLGTDLPYEFRALETMLGSIITSLEGELGVLKTLVSSLLDGLERNIEREKLKQLLLYSRRLSSFNSRALLVQECLDEVLENDQDMADSYLSEKILKKTPRDSNDHEELEQLLESFSKYVEEIVHEGKSILTNIKSTEEIIELILDSNRNTLLALDLKVSITTMGLGTGALLAGLFGMNLETGLEHHPLAFIGASGVAIMIVGVAIGIGWVKLFRLRRIGLSEAPISSRSPIRFYNHHQQQQGGVLDWDVPFEKSKRNGVK
ncbi:hypothetical protein CROQUDRAFT_655442 [Cronartium quercuum f. sp. fusiforme G11]|uniref:Magnesium transporter n=1 Tax=Cronartium quercuum f. sp. fusiforme G11 TaxID=708437 RepID=A0A9P6NLA4_9BASI|nr:hypothetical protein CROQUDRAFT_655442 [Cronartium quercuum f. sp. fusiforme G11]